MLTISRIHSVCWEGKASLILSMTTQFTAPLAGSLPSSAWARKLSGKFSLLLVR